MQRHCAVLRASPVECQDTYERLLELLVGERIAERVDRTVEVADPVGDVVQCGSDRTRQGAVLTREPDDKRQDVPWYPADHERTQNDGDRSQSFAGPVVIAC